MAAARKQKANKMLIIIVVAMVLTGLTIGMVLLSLNEEPTDLEDEDDENDDNETTDNTDDDDGG